MTSVFDKRYTLGRLPLRERILRIIPCDDWISMGTIYRKLYNGEKRSDVHPVILELLAEKVVRMRVIKPRGPSRTEFRRVTLG